MPKHFEHSAILMLYFTLQVRRKLLPLQLRGKNIFFQRKSIDNGIYTKREGWKLPEAGTLRS